MGAGARLRAARSLESVVRLVVVGAMALGALVGPAPVAAAHTDPETGAAVYGADNESYTTPAALDGKTFTNPRARVVLQDNSPTLYSYNGGKTSTTAYLELDLTLAPSGPCPNRPSGYVEVHKRDLDTDLSPTSPWRYTSSFNKSAPCSYASRGETWHWGRDSIGLVTEGARDFEIRLVDRTTGAIYLTAVGKGAHVTPNAPTAVTATPGIAPTVELRWQDNSWWENHMEVQRAGEVGTPWTTIARVYGSATYQDQVPFSPSNLFRYRVRAVAGDRASEWSPVVATSPPSPPLNFRATEVARTSVTFEWDDAYGESSYEVERSRDGFATIERTWDLPAGSTSLVDSQPESLETYEYRIRSRHDAGASEWSSEEVSTPGLLEPEVPGFVDAAMACPSDGMTLDWIGSCIYGAMYEYDVLVFEAKICETHDGVVINCQKIVFHTLAASDRPHLPDDEDPGVPPPPPGPDGEKWVPPIDPGEHPWSWGSSVDDFPTKAGSWSRLCADGVREQKLHWDSPHVLPKPDHWGFTDCLGKVWEMPMDWLQYGRDWYPRGHEWW